MATRDSPCSKRREPPQLRGLQGSSFSQMPTRPFVDRLGMAAHWFRWSLAPGALRQGPNVVEVELLKAEPTATFERASVALLPSPPRFASVFSCRAMIDGGWCGLVVLACRLNGVSIATRYATFERPAWHEILGGQDRVRPSL